MYIMCILCVYMCMSNMCVCIYMCMHTHNHSEDLLFREMSHNHHFPSFCQSISPIQALGTLRCHPSLTPLSALLPSGPSLSWRLLLPVQCDSTTPLSPVQFTPAAGHQYLLNELCRGVGKVGYPPRTSPSSFPFSPSSHKTSYFDLHFPNFLQSQP